MEREVWLRIVSLLETLDNAPSRRFTFSPGDVLRVLLWAVLWNRPIYWACRPENWPADVRPRVLPTPSTMSRRLRKIDLVQTLRALERRVRGPQRLALLYILDGKAITIPKHSTDPDSRFGRGSGGLAKGYKLHVLIDQYGQLREWCVRPLNVDEAKTAEHELLPHFRGTGYVLADANYDRNHLHAACRERGLQLLTPRRYGPGRRVGHRRQDPGRLRSIDRLEHSLTGFGPQLYEQRRAVERWLSQFTHCALGLTHLPPGTRTLPRVTLHTAAKLLIFHLARRIKKSQRRTG